MRRFLTCLPVLLLATALVPTAVVGDEEEPALVGYAIHAGRILTMAGPPIETGTILVSGGKVEAIGRREDVTVPPGYEVVDRPDAWALPGFVDIHSHAGGSDINDMVYQVNPDLRVDDNVVPDNPLLRRACRGGVTTILFLPGSGTNLSGFAVLMKTAGATPEEVIVRFPGALKVAQAGNPERNAGDLGHGRAGMSHLIRTTVAEGLEYGRAWMAHERGEREAPRVDDRYEMFRGLAKGEFPVLVHTQWAHVLQATVRLFHDELGLPVVLSHASFESYRNGPLCAERGVAVNVGPRQIYLDPKDGRIHGLAAEWWAGGVRNLTLNTDAPVIPQEDLVVQAAAAVRFGLSEEAALRGITIVNARQLMIDDRVGSLEIGKDADVVLHSGPPLDLRTRILGVFVNGRPVTGPGAPQRPERPATMLPDEYEEDHE